MITFRQRQRLLLAAQTAERKAATRHKCFLSYHADDADEVATFIEEFDTIFIPRVIGVQQSDDFIDSSNTDYVLDRIREKYLTDSTVTIVMVGACTWARRFVDWEIYSSLRNDKNNRRNGLLAITLPSVAQDAARRLPPRADDNVDGTALYGRWRKYPKDGASLSAWIDDAFSARTSRADLIDNSRARKLRNSSCP